MVAGDDANSRPDTTAVIGCSVRGQKNEDTDTPCQDDNEKRTLSGNKYVIAAADGLGSASLSHVGSDTATQAVADFVEHKLAKIQSLDSETLRSVLEEAFVYARKQVEKKADSLGVSVSELNTTLLVAVGGSSMVGGAAVGDGGIVWHRGGETGLVIPREGTEYENETIPLQSDNWRESYRFGWVADADAAAVFSDGLDGVAWDGPVSVSDELFDQVFNSLQEYSDLDKLEEFLEEFLDGDSLRKSSRDDKTLVVGALPLSKWTDPSTVGHQESPSGDYPKPTSTDTDLPSGTSSPALSPQEAGQSPDHGKIEAGQGDVESIDESLGDDSKRRTATTVGIVALAAVVVVAGALIFGLGPLGDEPADDRTQPSGDPLNGVDDSVEAGGDNGNQNGEGADNGEGNNLIEDYEFERSTADRGDELHANTTVTGTLASSKMKVEYFLENESGSEEIIDTKDIGPNEPGEVQLKGRIDNSTTALDNETVKQGIRVVRIDTETSNLSPGIPGNIIDTKNQSLELSHSIQAAVEVAERNNEETVEAFSGTYNESVIVNVADLIIEAADQADVTINASGQNEAALQSDVSGVEVRGLNIEGDADNDVISHAGSGRLIVDNSTLNVTIQDSPQPVEAIDTRNGSSVKVLNSTVVGFNEDSESYARGIYLNNSNGGAANGNIIHNITFRGDLSSGTRINFHADNNDERNNIRITNSSFKNEILGIVLEVSNAPVGDNGEEEMKRFNGIEVGYNAFSGNVGTALYHDPDSSSEESEFLLSQCENSDGLDNLAVIENGGPENTNTNANMMRRGNQSGPTHNGNGETGATASDGVEYDARTEVRPDDCDVVSGNGQDNSGSDGGD